MKKNAVEIIAGIVVLVLILAVVFIIIGKVKPNGNKTTDKKPTTITTKKTTDKKTSTKKTTKKQTTSKDDPVVYDNTIIYNLDGGENNPGNPEGFMNGETVVLLNPHKTDYDFMGWYTSPSFAENSKIETLTMDIDYEIYAKFVPTKYTITYVNIDGLVNNNPDEFICTDSIIELIDVTKPAYTFLGWYTTSTFDVDSKIEEIDPSSRTNYTLYAKFEKDKVMPIVEVTPNTLEYTGLEQELVSATIDDSGTIYYSLDNENYSTDIPTGINAKEYTVFYKVIGDSEHLDILDQSVTVTINKANYNMENVTFSNSSKEYNGNAQSLEITGELPTGVTVNYSSDTDCTNVGSHIITASFTGDSNHNEIENMTATLTITKATYDMSNVHFENATKEYTGDAQSIEITGTLPAGVSVSYEGNGTNVGSYPITAIFSGDANHFAIPNMTATLTITKATYDMSNVHFENATKEYDGGVKSIYITGTLPTGVSVTYENNDKTNVGDYEVIAKFSVDANHNEIENMTATLTITKASYDMSSVHFDDLTITYDGDAHSITITGTLPTGVSVEYDGNGKINAGTYTITAIFTKDNPNYNDIADMTATLMIEKATVTPTLPTAISGLVYNGTAQTLINAGSITVGSIEYKYADQDWSTTPSKGTYPGTYEVEYRFVLNDNYNAIDGGTINVTIDKATIDLDEIISFNDASKVYTGTEQSLTITGELPSYVFVSYSDGGTNVGQYEITASFTADESLYKPISDKTAILTITPASITGAVVTGYNGINDGESHNIVTSKTATTVDNSDITWLYSKDQVNWLAEILVSSHSDAGTYYFKASAANHTDYIGHFDVIISDKNLTTIEITNLDDLNKEYDGSSIDTPSINTNSDGEITVTYSADGTTFTDEKPKNAGTYIIKVETAETETYARGSIQATIEITKAPYDMSGIHFDNSTVTYDGDAHSINITGTLPTGVSVSYEGNGKTNAGTYTVTAIFTNDNPNYKDIANMTATLIIEKAAIDISGISFDNASKQYNGNIQALEITGTLPDGITGVTYECDKEIKNVGTYTIYAIFEYDTENYEPVSSLSAVLTITKGVYDMSGISFNDATYTFDNLPHRIVISGTLPEGVTVSYNDTDSYTNVGTYDYIAYFTGDSDNYELIANKTATLTISKKTIDLSGITFSGATYTYDGSVKSLTYTGTLPDEITNVAYTNNDQTDAGDYEVTLTFIYDATNYIASTDSMKATLTINKKEIDNSGITLPDGTFTYDGSVKSLAYSGTLPSGITGVNYEGNNKVNAGSYDVVMTFNYDINNYTVTTSQVSGVLTINKATPTTLGITVNYDEGIGSFFSTNKTTSSITYNGTYDVSGTIQYNDARENLEIGTLSYSYIFTPTDSTNYESVTGTVEIITKATVKYYDGETLLNTLYVAKNDTATNSALPAKTGYTADGWTLKNVSTLYNFSTPITSNIELYTKYELTYYTIDYDLGSGTLVDPIVSYSIETETFTLPTPTSDVATFDGWIGEGITTPTLSVQITKGSTGNRTYVAVWTPLNDVAYFLNNTSKRYKTIEQALNAATSGDIVCVIPPEGDNYHSDSNNVSSTEKVTYYINSNCEIKSGVTLVLPTDSAHISSVTSSSTLTTYIDSMRKDATSKPNGALSTYGQFARSSEAKYLRVTVEIAQGVTLTNNGTLVVSGYLSGGISTGGVFGQTSHSYSQIVLNANSKILQNNTNAKTYCFGYITEKVKNNSSITEFAKGTLYIPFIVDDYRGFSYSWAMTDGAIDNYGCSAFNQFDFRNIDSLVQFDYNSIVIGVINTYVTYSSSFVNVNENFYNELNILGNSNSYVFQLTDSTYSYLTYKYDVSTQVAEAIFYGGMTLNNLSLTLSKSPITVNLSTTNGYFPVSWRQNVKLLKAEGQTSATYNTSKQSIKLLPGACLEIGDGCTLTAKKVIVYTAFGDGSSFNGASSACGQSQNYPLKPGAIFQINDGATASFTAIAGNVYYDNASVTYSTNGNTIVAYEPWSIGSSGSTNPAWTIKDYLEIRESLQKTPISYRTTKQKLYCGINTFKNYDNYLPAYKVTIAGNDYTVNQYQKVLFLDSISSYSITLVSNIYKCFYGNKTYYQKDSTVTYNSSLPYFFAINSTVSISSNKSGVNEFNVQSITINCTTPTVGGNYPLYPGTVINLEAVIVDSTKVYNKTVTWTSSDTSIATVASDGKVTGVALGQVTITATCDGKSATIVLNVIEEQQLDQIEQIYITDNKGGDSRTIKGSTDTTGDGNANYDYNGGEYSNNTNVTVTLNILPNTAPYASIVWTFNASLAGRQYVYDKTVATETIENQTSVLIHVVSGSGASADGFSITCKVTDLNGQIFTATFKMAHKSEGCLATGTLITLSDGSQKRIEDLTFNDKIIAYNFFTGQFEEKSISILVFHGYNNYNVLNLEYSDGTVLRTILDHGIFDYDLNKYVYPTSNDYLDYIGHRFVKYNPITNSYDLVTLENAYYTFEYVGAYSLSSYESSNALAEGLLTVAPPDDFYNWIEMSDKMQYDVEQFQRDIEEYGLYSYEVFEEYVSYEQYLAFNGAYLKIPVEKGYFTFEYIIELIKLYGSYFPE